MVRAVLSVSSFIVVRCWVNSILPSGPSVRAVSSIFCKWPLIWSVSIAIERRYFIALRRSFAFVSLSTMLTSVSISRSRLQSAARKQMPAATASPMSVMVWIGSCVAIRSRSIAINSSSVCGAVARSVATGCLRFFLFFSFVRLGVILYYEKPLVYLA